MISGAQVTQGEAVTYPIANPYCRLAHGQTFPMAGRAESVQICDLHAPSSALKEGQ